MKHTKDDFCLTVYRNGEIVEILNGNLEGLTTYYFYCRDNFIHKKNNTYVISQNG